MTWNGQLSRISIETVLHFMNPNKRINASVACPEVRNLGRQLKLKEIVDYLNEFKKYPVLRSSDQKAVAAKEEEAAKLREEIIKYNERRAISELKYEEFIMFTQTDQNGEQVRTEYIKYDRPLKDAWRYFVDRYVLGCKRRGPVIERLSVSHPEPQLIFQESRLSSRNLVLSITGTRSLDNAMNLLKEECIPLNSVETSATEEFNHQLLATARTLTVANSTAFLVRQPFRNDVVCFKQIRSDVVVMSIDFWRQHGLPQQKQYIFETFVRRDAKHLLLTFQEYLQRRNIDNFYRNNFPIQFQFQLQSGVRTMQIQVTFDRVVTENPDVYNYVIDMTAIPE